MPDLPAAETGDLACPSCTHPWTAHGTDGCAYAEPGGCWCGNTGAATAPAPGHPVLGEAERAALHGILDQLVVHNDLMAELLRTLSQPWWRRLFR